MPILVATDREVLVIDVERGTSLRSVAIDPGEPDGVVVSASSGSVLRVRGWPF